MRLILLRICAGMLFLLMLSIASTGHAVSYQPPFRLVTGNGSVVVKGGFVHLFHSGTHDTTDTVRSGDIFIVSRTSPSCIMQEVGRVRFVNFVGDTYMEAEVVEGEIKAGDIAKKGNISYLIVSTEQCTH
jgi:hypothetical protein